MKATVIPMNQDPRISGAEMTAAPQTPPPLKEPVSRAIRRWPMHPLATAFPSGYKYVVIATALALAVLMIMMTVLTAAVCVTNGSFRLPSFFLDLEDKPTLEGVAGQDGDRPFADGKTGDVLLPLAQDAQVISKDKLHSSNAVLADVTAGEVIASRQGNEVIYPASMTKVMTLIVVVENLPREDCLKDTITVSQNVYDRMYAEGSSGFGFKTGDILTVEDLLYALMLQSDGIAACELARYVAGSEEDFVELMNQKAEKMGLKNTKFMNPTGLHHAEHVSSCRDIASIMAYAMKMSLCRKVLMTNAYPTTYTLADGQSRACTFYHKLTVTHFGNVTNPQPKTVTVLTGKTGYTDESRHCLVTYAETKDGKGYVCVTASAASYYEYIEDYITIYNTYVK